MKLLPGHTYAFRVLLYLDYLAAALLWRMPGVTISSRCGLALRARRPGASARAKRALGRVLNWIDTDHCEKAIASDIRAARRVLELLGGESPRHR